MQVVGRNRRFARGRCVKYSLKLKSLEVGNIFVNAHAAQIVIDDQQTQKYLTLLEISKAIRSHQELSGFFHDLACRLQNLFPFRDLAVMLHDGRKNVMRSYTMEGCDAEEWIGREPTEVSVSVPPLRERPEDIPLLVHFFANKFAQQMKRRIESVPKETMAALVNYHWPGNIRELQNLIERGVILSRGSTLEIPLGELKQARAGATKNSEHANGSTTLESVEREHILRVLNESKWVIGGPGGAAARLGINRTTLNHRLRKLGITRPQPQF